MPSASQSVSLKLTHTKVHFDRLQAEVKAYYALYPASLMIHPNSNADSPAVQLQTNIPIPQRIPLIAGDCLQNLRSTLDYLVWELVLRTGGTPKKQSFPICTSEGGWNACCEPRLRHVTPNAVSAIRGMQPFKSDDFTTHPLYILDELVNMNKHRHLILTMLGGTDMMTFQAVGDTGLVLGEAIADEHGKVAAHIVQGSEYPQADVATFIAFADGPAERIEICTVIAKLISWMDILALPLFDSFLT